MKPIYLDVTDEKGEINVIYVIDKTDVIIATDKMI